MLGLIGWSLASYRAQRRALAGLESPARKDRGHVKRRFLIALPFLLFAALVALFYVRLQAGDPSQLPSALIGRPAPDFTLPALDGLKNPDGTPVPGLTSADLAQGRGHHRQCLGLVVRAVPAGAPAAAAPLPARPRARGRHRPTRTTPKNAKGFLEELGNPFAAIGMDEKGRAAIDWGVYGVPETFIVDGKGRIAYKHIGPLTDSAITDIILPEIDKAEHGTAAASRPPLAGVEASFVPFETLHLDDGARMDSPRRHPQFLAEPCSQIGRKRNVSVTISQRRARESFKLAPSDSADRAQYVVKA